MLNMIKMDLYRMFRTKSMYVVWIVLAVSVLFTTFMCKLVDCLEKCLIYRHIRRFAD